MAAAERRKRVITGKNQIMSVGDHDITKLNIILSVDFLIDIPDDINGSFYRGQVCIGFKNDILQPSSAICRASELKQVLQNQSDLIKPVLLLYTDGGPDHRNTYLSVKLSLIALFLLLDLDMLISLHTAPCNSWANPVERVMSIVNIGLQGMGIMRTRMSDEFEKVTKGENVKQLMEIIESDQFKQELKDSLATPIELLNSQMQRFSLKGKSFEIFTPASEAEIDVLWQQIMVLVSQILRDKTTKAQTEKSYTFKQFLKKSLQRNSLSEKM